MSNSNSVTVSCNLTRDPELRATAAGTQVLTFGIACNDWRRGENGEGVEYANFFDVVMFGARAEALARILTKGTKVAVEGKLRYSSWERDGQRRSKIEIIAFNLDFISRKGDVAAAAAAAGAMPAADPIADPNVVYDEDIPF